LGPGSPLGSASEPARNLWENGGSQREQGDCGHQQQFKLNLGGRKIKKIYFLSVTRLPFELASAVGELEVNRYALLFDLY